MRRILQMLRSTQTAFAAILLFGLLAMTARNALDPDLWWHLRTGQWIVETGHVPHFDPFSFTRAGHAWVSHEWLSEVVFYELWKRGGPSALIVFSAIVSTAGFMLLYLRCPQSAGTRHWAAAATALGALACAPSWGTRPQMFTFILASLLLWLVERGEHRPKLLFWIPPLFLLWLNLHAGFALAPALLIAYAIGLIMETALGNTPWREARPILLRLLLLLLACFALVPLNPNGAQLYRYPFDTLRSAEMRSLIGEWHSPDFHQGLYRPFLLVCLLLLTALASSRSRPRGRMIIPLLLTAFAALDAVRHIPIFVLLAIPVIAAALPVAPAPSLLSPPRSRLLAVPAAFQRSRGRSAGCVCFGEVGRSCPQPGCPRGRAVPQKGGRVPARQRLPSQSLRLLRLGRLCHLETLSRVSRVHRRPRRSLWCRRSAAVQDGNPTPHRLARRSG